MSKIVLKSAPLYGITEYLTKWIVQIKRNGQPYFKSFAFSTYGGKAESLRVAQEWRDEIVRTHPPVEKRQQAQRLRANNTSGVPGVCCQHSKNGTPVRWVVHTCIEPGRILTKSFGIKRYGNEQAKAMAIAERERQLTLMKGLNSRHPAAEVEDADSPTSQRARAAMRALNQKIESAMSEAQTRTVTGIAGVWRTIGRNGQPQSWTAHTHHAGVKLLKSFAVRVYGEDKARELAIAERQKQLALVAKSREKLASSKKKSAPHRTNPASDLETGAR